MERAVPFYAQKWDLDDWKALGFTSRDEAAYWEGSSCGVLCLKMGVEGMTGRTVMPVSKIIEHGQRMGAYAHGKGWSHGGLARLAHVFGVGAAALEPLSMDDIKRYIHAGCLCIVSIKWAFDPKHSWKERILFWKKYGGHLALVTGHDENGFYVHHTSIRPEYNWENRLIPFSIFAKGFTDRGIVLMPAQ